MVVDLAFIILVVVFLLKLYRFSPLSIILTPDAPMVPPPLNVYLVKHFLIYLSGLLTI